jgi:hypothetical protein
VGPEKFAHVLVVREAPRVSRVAQLQRRLATLDSSPMAWTSGFDASAFCRRLLTHGSSNYKQTAGNRMLAPRAKSAPLNLSGCSQTIKNRAAHRRECFRVDAEKGQRNFFSRAAGKSRIDKRCQRWRVPALRTAEDVLSLPKTLLMGKVRLGGFESQITAKCNLGCLLEKQVHSPEQSCVEHGASMNALRFAQRSTAPQIIWP